MKDDVNISDGELHKIAKYFYERLNKEERDKRYASAKQVLMLLGTGVTIASAFLAPRVAVGFGPLFLSHEGTYDPKKWKQYNPSYLRQAIKRFETQKLVERDTINGEEVLRISQQGKVKILKYNLDDLEIEKPKSWDGKWRVVIYDIPTRERSMQQMIRQTLKMLGFYAIQESVYVIPYSCYDKIEFLRSYYGLGANIKYLLVTQLEDDQAYRDYFGLD
jgi:hypothetical protein